MLCFYCLTQSKKGNLLSERNKEETYISRGFRSWKNAPKCFEEHQNSNCHKAAASYHVIQTRDVGELINQNLVDSSKENRAYLFAIMRCLRYLARQGIAIQVTHDNDNFTQLLKLIGTKDASIIDILNQGSQKFTHHDAQNELLDIMAKQVLSKKIEAIRKGFYSIMCDEGTDCRNLEHLHFNTRIVDDELEVHEDFLGFYEIENITSDTIVSAIKDVLLRFNLSLDLCRGQIYDGASNTVGKKSGVATQISKIQPKALLTHCYGHSLSLAVKDLTSNCNILGDTMGTVGEITVLIKNSPKREKMLGSLTENVEGLEESQEGKGDSLDKMSVTQWTVRANWFKKIIDHYNSLQQLWEDCLQENLTKDVRFRIIGCQAQMKTFSFLFGLCLGQSLYCHTDNLSKAFQNQNMSAVSGHRLALLTEETLENMRNETSFKLFFDLVVKKAADIPKLDGPALPRKRNRPNYSILSYVDGHKSAEAHHPTTVEEHYTELYYDAIDNIKQAIMTRFNQPSFKVFSTIEQLLLKGIEEDDISVEIAESQKIYGEDVNFGSISSELQSLKTVLNGDKPSHIHDVVKTLKSRDRTTWLLIPSVIKVIKLLLVMASTSATAERSFSSMQRLKTWLRSTMKQKRLNSLAILSTHKDLTDEINFAEVGNTFVSGHEYRYNHFGHFTSEDL